MLVMTKAVLKDRITKALKIKSVKYSEEVFYDCLAYLNSEMISPQPLGFFDLKTPLGFGAHSEKTLEDLLEENPYYVNWLIKNHVIDISNQDYNIIKKRLKTVKNRNIRHYTKREPIEKRENISLEIQGYITF